MLESAAAAAALMGATDEEEDVSASAPWFSDCRVNV